MHHLVERLCRRIGILGDTQPISESPISLALQLLAARTKPVNLIQIGAFDGKQNDPLQQFLCVDHFSAILLEPIAPSYQKLLELHRYSKRVTCVQAAVAHQSGIAPMYTIRKDCPYNGDQLSSFSRRHLRRSGVKDCDIVEVSVPTLSLNDLCNHYQVPRIDLLQIDTEGFDAEVVGMALDLSTQPEFIGFEHTHLKRRDLRRLNRRLHACGYDFTNAEVDTLAWKRFQ